MAQKCTVDDLTVDAMIHGEIMEVESFDHESSEYIAAKFRQPIIDALFCSNCGEYLFEGGLPDEGIHSVVVEHIERSNDVSNNHG